MMDYLVRADDEAAAMELLPEYVIADVDGVPPGWDQSRVFAGVVVILDPGEYDYTDPENTITIWPAVIASGFYVMIADELLRKDLRDLPGGACRMICDRDASMADQPYVVYLAPGIEPSDLVGALVAPIPFGSNYRPFSLDLIL